VDSELAVRDRSHRWNAGRWALFEEGYELIVNRTIRGAAHALTFPISPAKADLPAYCEQRQSSPRC